MPVETSRDRSETGKQPSRIAALDVARGVALIAMATYHFTWDLEFFSYLPPGFTAIGGWKIFARCIATSFLFLAGVSLYLAHAKGIRWQGFWKRFAMVAGAALAISAVTYFAFPDGFIFFGILHQIALASLIGLAFLRLPALLTLAVAACVVAAPMYLRSDVFNHPALWWIGLSSVNPRSNDYVPLLPWFGAVLTGIGAAKLATDFGLIARLANIRFGAWSRPLAFGGRHSLAFYLIHQPVLIACVWAFAQIFPAPAIPREELFRLSCERSCGQTRDALFCTHYCTCMFDALTRDGRIEGVFAGDQSDELRQQVGDTAVICTGQTEEALPLPDDE